jgi:hypothetical protein
MSAALNAIRKIDSAIARGWTPALRIGPSRFAQLSRKERQERIRAYTGTADNRWRPSPVIREEEVLS